MKNKSKIIILIVLILGTLGLWLKIQSKPSPNILLITVDSLRPDHLSCYGYSRNTSPNIDKLARQGVIFKQAIAQASWTWPSMHSLITSLYPRTHKVYFYDQSFSNLTLTLPYLLRNEEYRTGFISGHGGLRNFNLGFDKFKDIPVKGEEITQEALRWIKNDKNKKFFLWMHYMDTHHNLIGVSEEDNFKNKMSKKTIENYISKYDQVISYVDNQIGILLEGLNKLDLYKNTVLIFTADHGEEMGEHDAVYFIHGGLLWDAVIRVPLIISSPNNLFKNKTILKQVQHIDILPTVCDFLNIKKLKSFEGNSLLPLIKGRNFNFPYAFSEVIQNTPDFLSFDKWLRTQVALRTVDWKLIFNLKGNAEFFSEFDLMQVA